MADTDFTTDEQTAVTVIPQYNILPYNQANNPYGFGDYGQRYNYLPLANQISTLAKAGRRFALFSQAQAVLTAADRTQTGQDRTAAQNASNLSYKYAQNPEDSAISSGVYSAFHWMRKALAWSTLSSNWANAAEDTVVQDGKFSAFHWMRKAFLQADRAQGYAQGLNIPALNSSVAGQFLKANSGGTAYEFGTITTATTSDIKTGTGIGFANAQNLAPVLTDIGPNVGDLLESFKIGGVGSANWIECNGAIVTKATYPDLFAAIGQLFADFSNLADGNSSGIAQPLVEIAYIDGFTFLNYSDTTVANNRLVYSTNDGVSQTLVTISGTLSALRFNDIFKFKGSYIALPSILTQSSLFSSDGINWTVVAEDAGIANQPVAYATDGNIILGIINNSTGLWSKSTAAGKFVNLGNKLPATATSGKRTLAFGNGVFVANLSDNTIRWSSDQGNTWTVCTYPGNVLGYQIIFANGKFYAFASGTSILVSTDGKTFTRLVSITESNLSIQAIQFDGERLLFISNNFDVYAVMPNGSYYITGLNINARNMGSAFKDLKYAFRQTDGLYNAKDTGPTTVLRGKLAPNKSTEFQLPKLIGQSTTKMFIRGKQ